MKHRLLFRLPTIEDTLISQKKHEKKGKGLQKAIKEYVDRADSIGADMEENRVIDLTCSSLNIHHYAEMIQKIHDEVFLVCNNDEFFNC